MSQNVFAETRSFAILINSREAIAAIIGDIVFFFNSPSPSMILVTIDFLIFIVFYLFAVNLCAWRHLFCF